MGAGERETLGRQSGASVELLACGDGGLKPPVEKGLNLCPNFIVVTILLQVHCSNCIVIHLLFRVYCANFIILNFTMSQLYCSHLEEERDV